jgi:hypothetical protein
MLWRRIFQENEAAKEIESIWIQFTPERAIRTGSTILVACIYHPTWADQNQNLLLYELRAVYMIPLCRDEMRDDSDVLK